VFPQKDGLDPHRRLDAVPVFPRARAERLPQAAAREDPRAPDPRRRRVRRQGGVSHHARRLRGAARAQVRQAVKIAYERNEDILYTTKRHPVWVRYKTGFKKDGTLTAIECDFILDGGAYLTISDVVMFRGILHCAVAYRCENVVIRGKVARTNSFPCGAFRGFGAPQAIWGMESHMDAIAARLGRTPHVLRLQLHARPGDVTPTGQILPTGKTARPPACELALKRSDFAKKLKQASRGRLRKGQKKLVRRRPLVLRPRVRVHGRRRGQVQGQGPRGTRAARRRQARRGHPRLVHGDGPGRAYHLHADRGGRAVARSRAHPLPHGGHRPRAQLGPDGRVAHHHGRRQRRAPRRAGSQAADRGLRLAALLPGRPGRAARRRSSWPRAASPSVREGREGAAGRDRPGQRLLPVRAAARHPLGPGHVQGRFLPRLFVVGQRRGNRDRSAHVRARGQARHGGRRRRPRHQSHAGFRARSKAA
jgi:hypothetical protein